MMGIKEYMELVILRFTTKLYRIVVQRQAETIKRQREVIDALKAEKGSGADET